MRGGAPRSDPASAAQEAAGEPHKPLLRLILCGSVDDGKSTLIGRLLLDAGLVAEDERAAIEEESMRRGNGIDPSLLVDGLTAEREQGITIDVAYRFFATPRRTFIVADAPGHEQYTRNMVTGASTADLAVLLVDARKGVLTQTRRHAWLARLMGIRCVVLAVNKMDLVGHEEERFRRIATDFAAFAKQAGIGETVAIPVSALGGDNVVVRSGAMPWYDGPVLLELLEGIDVAGPDASDEPFRMPVQLVCRPHQDFRGFAGMIARGAVKAGDEVRVLPSGQATRIARIVTMDGDLSEAVAGQSVTLSFENEVDCARGDVIAAGRAPRPDCADQFEATVIWMGDDPLFPGRPYWLKLGARTVSASIQSLKYQVNVNTAEHLAARTLEMNGIGVANVATDAPLVFESYETCRDLGGFILIDKVSNATVAAGMVHFPLRRSHNVRWQTAAVTREAHAAQKGQRPRVVWFTGLSGAGKSTIANLVERKLYEAGRHSFLLDGDNMRLGLNRDLGFTDADRVENIRRAGEVAKLMSDAGLIVLVAFISPFRAERRMARNMVPEGEFLEVFVDTPLEEAERRDAKGLYRKARAGELRNFTGIDSPYEPPENPEIRIDTLRMSPEEAAEEIVRRVLEG